MMVLLPKVCAPKSNLELQSDSYRRVNFNFDEIELAKDIVWEENKLTSSPLPYAEEHLSGCHYEHI
jgi:hypothetical protein